MKYITYIFQAYIKIIKLYKKGENMDINNKKATRQSYGEALLELGKENENIVVLDSDLASATKTDLFAKEFPE